MSQENETKKKLSFKHEWNNFSIYCWSLMEKCLTKLTDEERSKFKKDIIESKTSLNKIKIVTENKQVMNHLYDHIDYLNNKNTIDHKKDNKFALSCKKIGDAYLAKGNYQKALKFYSKSILFFDNESTGLEGNNESGNSNQSLDEQISLCSLFISRAKVLIKLELFNDAYADFQKALDLDPDTQKIDFSLEDLASLYKRKTVDFSISEPNKKLDGASSAVRMGYCEDKGRMIYSEKKIEEGEILFMEEPYVHWLRPSYYEAYCHQCLKRLGKHVFIPCNCCTEVRYCSIECRDVSWNRYHKTECKYLKLLKKWPSGHMALRLVLRDGLDYALEENRKESEPLSAWPKLGFKCNYSSIKSLTGEDNFKDGDYYCPLVIGCVLIGLLFEINKEIKKEDLEQFSAMLIKSIMQILENTFMIYDYDMKTVEEDDFLEEAESIGNSKNSLNLTTTQSKFHQISSTSFKIGVGLYSSSSLLPHSCDNNSNKYYFGSSILIVAGKTIEKNNEVNIEYGVHYKMNSLKYRKNYLNNNFGFDCKCTACLNGYENVGLSYKCLKCQTGALVVNEDSTNYCMNCDAKNLDVSSIDLTIKKAEEHFHNGVEAYKENNIKKAELEFRLGDKICTKVYYSNTKVQFIKSELSHLYVLKKNYTLAYQYSMECLPVNKYLYGPNSVEVLSNQIELACLAIECIENLTRVGFSVKQASQKLFRQLMSRMSNKKERTRDLEELNLEKIEKKLSNLNELSKWKIILKRHYQTIEKLYYQISRREAKIVSEDSIITLKRLVHLKDYLKKLEI